MVKRTKKVAKATTTRVSQRATAKKKSTKSVKKSSSANKNSVKPTKKRASQSSKTKNKKNSSKSYVPFTAMVVLLGLFVVSLFMLFRDSKHSADAVILHDLHRLHQIFESINQDCKIIDFEHTKNYIDFLTVKEFVGSEVGAMNLSQPGNWKGPYVKDNPTVHEQQYIVLKNKSGYYLVPGDGVKLANGKIIGKDIILDDQTDIEQLLQDDKALKTSDGSLGVKLSMGGSYIKHVLQSPLRYL